MLKAFITGGIAGVSYDGFRAYLETSFDTVVKFQVSLGVGYRFNLTKKITPKDIEELESKDRQERLEKAQQTLELIENSEEDTGASEVPAEE